MQPNQFDDYNISANGVDYDPDLLYNGRGSAAGNENRTAKRQSTETQQTSYSQHKQQPNQETRHTSNRKAANSNKKRITKEQQTAGIVTFFKDKRTHAVAGVALICLAVYIAIAAISFIRAGASDQSEVINLSVEQIVNTHTPIKNNAGPVGAALAQSFFAQGLGLGSLALIVYLLLLGFGLMGIKKCNFWSITFKTLLVAITTSLVLGLVSLWLSTETNLGGTHGLYMNQLLVSHINWIGAALISLFLIIAVIYVYINDLMRLYNGYKSLRKAQRAKAEQLRIEREEAQMRVKQAMENSELNEDHEPVEQPIETDQTDTQKQPEPLLVGFEDVPQNETDLYTNDTTDFTIQIPDDSMPVKPDPDEFSPSSSQTAEINTTQDEDEQRAEDHTNTHNPTMSSPGFEVYTNKIEEAKSDETEVYDPTAELSKYQRPTLELLHEIPVKTNSVDRQEQEENKERITKTLNDYGIPISHIDATVGPTVTLYEIIPAEGVRIAKIKRLEDDIAMSLAALGIRIIAPIPGKGTIGIEVPNKDPQTVAIRSILGSKAYQECRHKLPMAMGATISNDVYIADLAKMPHLLVAGATGMGKSVGLNTIIASLLYKKHPAELKFVLVDPKMVEFSLYSVLERHFLAKLPENEDAVVTDMDKVVRTLNSLCVEMDQRYMLLKEANVRSITEYNERFIQKRLNPEKGHRYLPYIVMIVDEFADLIMTAGKQVETPIARIAQKARAVGMHMIVATQRPSTNVITGIIKANFPGRIAFRVSQMVDSKTILDRTGANQLIGRGDMLFSHNGSMDRVQCAFIDTDEVQAICDHIDKQAGYEHAYYLPEPIMDDADGPLSMGSVVDRDPLFEEAAQIVVTSGVASTSSLQRRYSIGYNRAGKIMDQLEAAGIVGPSQGGKPRQVLIDVMQLGRILDNQE